MAVLTLITHGVAFAQDRSIIVASTTSTEQSGLFGFLLPRFTEKTGIKVKVVAVGTFEALSKKAQQLFGGPATTTLVNGRPRALVALDDHEIDLFISYCSSAQPIVRDSPKYQSIALPPELSVGPEYGLTVSRKAQAAAADFAMYLLSPQGQASLKAFGFIPVALPDGQ